METALKYVAIASFTYSAAAVLFCFLFVFGVIEGESMWKALTGISIVYVIICLIFTFLHARDEYRND